MQAVISNEKLYSPWSTSSFVSPHGARTTPRSSSRTRWPLLEPLLERAHLGRLLHQALERRRPRLGGKGVVPIDVLAKIRRRRSPLLTAIAVPAPSGFTAVRKLLDGVP